jgi:hypothetical protein
MGRMSLCCTTIDGSLQMPSAAFHVSAENVYNPSSVHGDSDDQDEQG